MNIYDPITVLSAVEEMPKAKTFLRDLFFPVKNDQVFLTDTVAIDTKKGRERLAPFVADGVGGATVSRDSYETSVVKPLRIAPQRVLRSEHINARGLGEDLITQKTPEQRAKELLAQDLKELSDMIERRMEHMVRELLFNGKIVMKGYIDHANKNFQESTITYGKAVALTPKKKWNEAGNDIATDLIKWKAEITKASGHSPTVAVMSSDVFAALLTNEAFGKLLDNRSISTGALAARDLGSGATYVGRIAICGLDLYTYDAYFEENESAEPMMPAGKILLAAEGLGNMRFGAITQLINGGFKTFQAAKAPKIWDDLNADTRMIRLTSRPVPVPASLDAWGVATVL